MIPKTTGVDFTSRVAILGHADLLSFSPSSRPAIVRPA